MWGKLLSTLISSIFLLSFIPTHSSLAQTKIPAQKKQQHAEIKAELGRLYRSLKDYQQALDYFKGASSLYAHPEYDLEQGWTLFLLEEYQAAQIAYAQAQHKLETLDDPELKRKLAYYQKLAQNLPAAEEQLQRLLLESNDAEDFLRLGQIYLLQKKLALAKTAFLKAYARYTSQGVPPVSLAYGLKESGERIASVRLFQQYWQQTPKAEYALALAVLLSPSEPQQALIWLDQLKRTQDLNPTEKLELAYLWLYLGQAEKSARLYQDVIYQLGNIKEPHILLGAAQALQDNHSSEALHYYLQLKEMVLSLDQRRAVAYGLSQFESWQDVQDMLLEIPNPDINTRLLLAQSAGKLGQKSRAAQLFLELLNQQEQFSNTQQRALVYGLIQSQQMQAALPLAQKLKHSAQAQDQLLLAQIHFHLGNTTQVKEILQGLGSKDSLSSLTGDDLNSLSRLWLALEEFSQAERFVSLALKQMPNHAALWILKGQILERRNALEPAQRAYLQAEHLSAQTQVSETELSTLALGLLQTGANVSKIRQQLEHQALKSNLIMLTLAQLTHAHAPKKAQQWLQKVEDNNVSQDSPDFVLLAQTHLLLRNYEQAKKYYQQLLSQFPDHKNHRKQFAAAALNNKDLDLAYQTYQEILTAYPQEDESRFNLALLERQAGRRWQSALLLKDITEERFKEKSTEEQQALFKQDILLSPEHDLKSVLSLSHQPMIFKGEKTTYLKAEANHHLIWHTRNPESDAQPEVKTIFNLGYSDYSARQPGRWSAFRELTAGLNLDYQYLGKLPVERFYLSPGLNYVFSQPQNAPILQYAQLNLTTGLVPSETFGLELRGLVNIGQQNLLLGSFLNYSLEGQFNRFWGDLVIGYTTGLQSYALFDSLSRQQDAFRWRNTLSLNWLHENISYQGEFDLSPIWGSFADLNYNSQHLIQHMMLENLYAQAKLEAHHYTNQLQSQQNLLSATAGIRWRLPLPESWPIYLGIDLQGNWFYQYESGINPGWLLSLRSQL